MEEAKMKKGASFPNERNSATSYFMMRSSALRLYNSRTVAGWLTGRAG